MDEKPKKTPSLLHRDANNKLIDADEGRKIAAELTQKLINEQRAVDKDNSMHFARTGRRDVVVHMAVTVLGSVDGHPIIGEPKEREYGQWCFVFKARQLPAPKSAVTKALVELTQFTRQAFIKLGMVREG